MLGLLHWAREPWEVGESPRSAAVPAHACTVRLLIPRLTIESVTMLELTLAASRSIPHVVVDLRHVEEVEAEAVEALIVLEAWLRKTASGLTIWVRAAHQLEPLEPIWSQVLIG